MTEWVYILFSGCIVLKGVSCSTHIIWLNFDIEQTTHIGGRGVGFRSKIFKYLIYIPYLNKIEKKSNIPDINT